MERVHAYDDDADALGRRPGSGSGLVERRIGPAGPVRRISWGAVFGGVVLALAVNLLLALLGVGIGLTTVDPAQPGGTPGAGALGIGAAIWWVASLIVAMFVGGFAAARLAGVHLSGDGVLHGLIAWGFVVLLTFYLLSSAVGSLVGGVLGSVSGGIQGIAGAVPEAVGGAGGSGGQPGAGGGGAIGQRVDEVIARIAPDASPQEVQQARQRLVSLVPQVLRGGEGAQQAREEATGILADLAGRTPEEVRTEIDQALQGAETQARQTADTAADTASTAALLGVAALALGAAAAAVGGRAGTRRRRDDEFVDAGDGTVVR
jgi:hypothetical protein